MRPPPGGGAPARVLLPGEEVLRGWYDHLHAHPELSGQEVQTARWAAEVLAGAGMTVRTGVGGHGVVATVRRGSGPSVVLRAELDALPVRSLPDTHRDGYGVPVSHACGHDVHLTAVLGAAAALAGAPTAWRGTLAVVLQPAEETGTGARAMLADGLAGLLPDVSQVLALHTSALPTGMVTFRPGVMTRAGVDLKVVFEGEGGHAAFAGERDGPLDAAVAWAHSVRDGMEPGVDVTVGSLRSGHCANVVADRAVVLVSLRADLLESCREQVRRIRTRLHGLAGERGRSARVRVRGEFAPAVNGPTAGASVFEALRSAGEEVYLLRAPSRACDDVGTLADGLGAELGYWFVGANAPERFDAADRGRVARGEQPQRVAGNHAPGFSPDPRVLGVAARQLVLSAQRGLMAEGGQA
ncbi:amidohydrolase [Ornithinimicrobium sufpigmenti]|uniref:amidohydrolase n=1 Tax=Ornithinimicrobium sufpigmenti TaxID=2508882 RepID=UPI0015E17F6C|nr:MULTISPECIES: amidohydrolase [unclassified Ornithinimicrobium]